MKREHALADHFFRKARSHEGLSNKEPAQGGTEGRAARDTRRGRRGGAVDDGRADVRSLFDAAEGQDDGGAASGGRRGKTRGAGNDGSGRAHIERERPQVAVIHANHRRSSSQCDAKLADAACGVLEREKGPSREKKKEAIAPFAHRVTHAR